MSEHLTAAHGDESKQAERWPSARGGRCRKPDLFRCPKNLLVGFLSVLPLAGDLAIFLQGGYCCVCATEARPKMSSYDTCRWLPARHEVVR